MSDHIRNEWQAFSSIILDRKTVSTQKDEKCNSIKPVMAEEIKNQMRTSLKNVLIVLEYAVNGPQILIFCNSSGEQMAEIMYNYQKDCETSHYPSVVA